MIIGSAIEASLEEGVRQRDLPLHKVDFAKGLVKFNSRFIRGTACLNEASNTYSVNLVKQPFLILYPLIQNC
jgi:hypothetical protein